MKNECKARDFKQDKTVGKILHKEPGYLIPVLTRWFQMPLLNHGMIESILRLLGNRKIRSFP